MFSLKGQIVSSSDFVGHVVFGCNCSKPPCRAKAAYVTQTCLGVLQCIEKKGDRSEANPVLKL